MRLAKVFTIKVNAPSPVTLHAVPKLSCKAKMVISNAVTTSLKPNTEVINPGDASTVPPGTPGAPMAKIPNQNLNRLNVDKSGRSEERRVGKEL